MKEFVVSGQCTLERDIPIIAETPQEAVLIFRRDNPDFTVETVVDEDQNVLVPIGYCDYSGKPIFEGDAYYRDGNDVYVLAEYVNQEDLIANDDESTDPD